MEIAVTVKKSLTPHQEDFVEHESCCCLCGSSLVFKHEIEWLTQKITEKAQCPSCGVQMKEKEHQLH